MERSKGVLQQVLLLSILVHASVDAAGYDDTINCEEFPEVNNFTEQQIREEAFRYGSCEVFSPTDTRPNPCSQFYRAGVDTYFLPHGRLAHFLDIFASDTNLVIDILRPECQDFAVRAVCYYYYPPCGNRTHFQPPNAVCQDTCLEITTDFCAQEWLRAVEFLEGLREFLIRERIQFITCNATDLYLRPVPHCCSNAGVIFPTDIANTTGGTSPATLLPSEDSSNSNTVILASVFASLVTILILGGVVVVAILLWHYLGKRKSKNSQPISLPEITISTDPPPTPGEARYVPAVSKPAEGDSSLNLSMPRARVNSAYIRNMSELKLLIPGRHIQLMDTIGQGEFGVVYRGHLTGWEGRVTAELVAVKTLKNFYSMKDVDDLMEESKKMEKFQHPNVLTLIGVCIDAGEAPYIIMPYMAKGSLLTYLRKERPHLTIAEEAGTEPITDAQRKLLSICLQIAKGMCYLAEQKFVHRDLAARNCMIDGRSVIKVADFGLSEDIYCRNYFRQGQVGEEGAAVKLPIRWMALESLLDSIFTEKTDVWSYGVTCWEVFSLGHTPYPAVDPFALVKFLQDGHRLDRPKNAACNEQVYELIRLCWVESCDKRPSFQELVQRVNSLLEGVAGYLDFSAFSGDSQTVQGYDHLEKETGNKGYDHLEKETGNKGYDHLELKAGRGYDHLEKGTAEKTVND